MRRHYNHLHFPPTGYTGSPPFPCCRIAVATTATREKKSSSPDAKSSRYRLALALPFPFLDSNFYEKGHQTHGSF